MARPIAPTPTLKGKDALEFITALHNVKKITLEERKEMDEAYNEIMSMIDFNF